MFTIEKTGPNRLDIEISGSLDAESMKTGLDQLISKSEDVSGGAMRYRVADLSMPTFGPLNLELQRIPQLFGLLKKYKRCAVLSDLAWIRTLAEVEGAFFPGLQVKSFELTDEAAAEAWLANV